MTDEMFYFEVLTPADSGEIRPLESDDEDYAVFLPHQCDEWVVACSPDKGTVLEDLRQFRAELDEAIKKVEEAQ